MNEKYKFYFIGFVHKTAKSRTFNSPSLAP